MIDIRVTEGSSDAVEADPAPLGRVESSSLLISVDRQRDRTLVLLGGDLDMSGYTRIAQLADEFILTRELVIDLAALSFIDLTGVGLLLGLRRRAEQLGRSFVLQAPSPAVQRLAAKIGLAGVHLFD